MSQHELLYIKQIPTQYGLYMYNKGKIVYILS